jgi:exodeoxyribonuclease VII large subunit
VSNAPEYTVSELAGNIKRTIEESFGRVRVRGELGRVTIARSGHAYLDLKDDRAVINSIMWKGTVSRLSIRPEEGMEVIVEGKMSTYPGRSNYQLIIDRMELAGEGALMALLEKRKKQFAAEGLFDADRKKPLPFMPRTIGVVTSPTGAVIRDILHRIEDRFPVHVLVWPVLVQGDRAAAQIAAAITGFNHADGFPRPDVLIVARGGGSLEDLWCFNEDVVVRAAAKSDIPLISAVGHETDTTLIDYVSDKRAPTPTGAAEVAVPVRDDWLETIADLGLRAKRGLRRSVGDRKLRLDGARLPGRHALLGRAEQRLDNANLPPLERLLKLKRTALTALRLPNLTQMIATKRSLVDRYRLPSISRLIDPKRAAMLELRLPNPMQFLSVKRSELKAQRLPPLDRVLDPRRMRLDKAGSLLEAYSYQGVLARGYALVQDAEGAVVRSSKGLQAGQTVTLTFEDGERAASIDGSTPLKKKQPKKAAAPVKGKLQKPPEPPQGSLF